MCGGSRTVRTREVTWGWRSFWLFHPQWMTQDFKLALGRQERDRFGAFALWRTLFAAFWNRIFSHGVHRDSHLAIYWWSPHHPEPAAAEPSLLCIPIPSSLLCSSTCPDIPHPQRQLEEEPERNWSFIISAALTSFSSPNKYKGKFSAKAQPPHQCKHPVEIGR